ncbi:MAG: disulfide bond formation protein B [Gammaproteobacteria bacterium]|nr:disulfide bond formation protein B [Gammaproteobacteria bacterium]
MTTSRLIFLGIFIACAGLLGFGLYLEHYQGLEPCPLCVLQRIAYIAVAIIALVAAIHGPAGLMKNVYAVLIMITSLAGAGIAGRQVWLQHLPPEKVPECGPGYDYLMEVFPLDDALGMIFTGSGECAEVDWTFLGFSIAEWSLVMFAGLCVVTIYLMISRNAASTAT